MDFIAHSIPGFSQAARAYDSMEPRDDEERAPERIEMQEYIATVQIPVMVPKYSLSPGIERDAAQRVAELFLKRAYGTADVITRDDMEEGEQDLDGTHIDDTDPYEIDTKHLGVVGVEPYVNPFNHRAIYRDELTERRAS